MASGDKFYLADKATLDEVKGKIGSTTDTGGSSTAGTMMAKENAILEKIGTTNDAQSSSTSTGSIFAKLNYLVSKMVNVYSWCNNMYSWFNTKIGNTDDTGGTANSGTSMGKLNKIIERCDAVIDDNDVIKAGTNLQMPVFANLPPEYTEVLNVTGEGYLSYMNLKGSTTGSTTKIKVYIDNNLFFDFGITLSGGTNLWQYLYTLSDEAGKVGNTLPYLNSFVGGNIITISSTNATAIAGRLLHFRYNLRVVACANTVSENDYVSVRYALKE